MSQDRRCGAQTSNGSCCKVRVYGEQQTCWMHSGPQCSICFAPLSDRTLRTLPCEHKFHTRCIDRWKRTCGASDPTCPMCRTPFDLPSYRCRLIIERVSDSNVQTIDYTTSNIQALALGFGVDFSTIVPSGPGRFTTDIRFDVEPREDLRQVLNDLGIIFDTLFDDRN